jgi:hypothetical protein
MQDITAIWTAVLPCCTLPHSEKAKIRGRMGALKAANNAAKTPRDKNSNHKITINVPMFSRKLFATYHLLVADCFIDLEASLGDPHKRVLEQRRLEDGG